MPFLTDLLLIFKSKKTPKKERKADAIRETTPTNYGTMNGEAKEEKKTQPVAPAPSDQLSPAPMVAALQSGAPQQQTPTPAPAPAAFFKATPGVEQKQEGILSLKQMQTIVDFLNAVHAPMGKQCWYVKKDFYNVLEPQKLVMYYEGPPLNARPRGNSDKPSGKVIKEMLYETFSEEAKTAGFSESFISRFKKNLETDRRYHKRSSYFTIKDVDIDFLQDLHTMATEYRLAHPKPSSIPRAGE